MIENFNGARIVITGGASGIGLALAKRMHADGAQLAICDTDEARVREVVIALPGTFGAVCDVTDADALEAFVDSAVDRLGGIDVGWNNAGVMQRSAPLQNLDWDEYQRVLNVNLHAVFRGSQLFARQMIAQGTPAMILNTGSENSLFNAVPQSAAYVASKMAVRAITEALRDDTPDHVAVKLLCPGFVNTALGPEAQFQHGMDVERFADIAYPLLLSDQFYLVSHGYNAVRVREDAERILADIDAGAASAEETKAFDTYTLMGRTR